MSTNTSDVRQDVRSQAERFLTEYDFVTPPLPPNEALAARKLNVTQLSLDDLLVKTNLTPADQGKIQAMLDIRDRGITFKNGLPTLKKNWGKLHEIGHEFLPWHRQLLYCCPLLWLPKHVQDQLEVEADIFAAEAFFFGSQFMKFANEGEFGLVTAKELSDEIYRTSYHATFVHFVEESSIPSCLLVWTPEDKSSDLLPPTQLKLHYYVPSKGFRGRVRIKAVTNDEQLLQLFSDPSTGIVKHEVRIGTEKGGKQLARAESFCNSYNVFTLVFQSKS